jgi:hypothetical protein
MKVSPQCKSVERTILDIQAQRQFMTHEDRSLGGDPASFNLLNADMQSRDMEPL